MHNEYLFEIITMNDIGSAYRLGSVTVHRLGHINFENPGHHTADYIYPVGFRSTRLYWSMKRPRTRTLYTFEVSCCMRVRGG